ncbi:DUF2637 domain-containing protein [Streptomyces cocklensis]|uniref:DUF2637 domain-containing protein n=1 Tax=Actinacidiphila cocklensis TaxID=887465 RepID=A0A9W4E3S6_9ACTN|nr:DUF2637 domain-containing protein [Actinacidiphila cocklensis]MDD1057889.1 DUF2637 domain-containing protein [Actinacidiphila cocklensis]CAG6392750.1 membrane hypothetical protein [Actinacidiphila cocklensis]
MKARDWTALGAVTATVLLTGFAFWLSYEHLHDVSAGHGLTSSRAWAWPACLDLFIVIGELLMLRASLARGGMDWWAVGLMVTGSGGSIALNVAGVGKDAPTLTYVVAAVPPVAALLAFGALMRQVHDHLAVEAEPFATAAELTAVPPEPAPEPITLERVEIAPPVAARQAPPLVFGPVVPVAELLAGTGPEQAEPRHLAEPVPRPERTEPEAEPKPEPAEVPPGVSVEHVTLAQLWLKSDPKLTGTAIGTRLGTSDSYGRRVRRAALELAGASS